MGRIADRYSRRAASVGPQTARLRGDVAKLLDTGLKDATQEQLYDRTPLPVSRAMFRSIRPRLLGNVVEVGYFFGRGAKYARHRLNMKGRSRSGGHDLTMNPAPALRKKTDPARRRLTRAAQRRILGAK